MLHIYQPAILRPIGTVIYRGRSSQMQYVLMAHSGGDGCFVVIVHGLPSNLVALWVIRANTGGEPCGDTERCSVCLGCFKRSGERG